MAKRDPNKPKKQARPGQTKGYCLPPDSGRIKPGEVRNRWGPRGKPKPKLQDPYEIAMSQTTRSIIDGKVTEISVELGILLVHAQKALAGSTASFNALNRARPRRGEQFDLLKAQEKEREEEEKAALGKILADKYIEMLDYVANAKRELGELRALRDGPATWYQEYPDPEAESEPEG